MSQRGKGNQPTPSRRSKGPTQAIVLRQPKVPAVGSRARLIQAKPVASPPVTIECSLTIPIVIPADGAGEPGTSTYVLNPVNKTDWWARHAALYNRYRITGLRVAYRSSLSSMSNGQVAVAFDSSGVAESLFDFQTASQSKPNFVASVHQSGHLEVHKERLGRLPWYDCQDPGEDGTNGSISIAWTSIGSTPAITPGQAFGSLHIDMLVQFRDPTGLSPLPKPVFQVTGVSRTGALTATATIINRTQRALAIDDPGAQVTYSVPAASSLAVPIQFVNNTRGRATVYTPGVSGVPSALLGWLNLNNVTNEYAVETPTLTQDSYDTSYGPTTAQTYTLAPYVQTIIARAAPSVFAALRL